MNFKDNFSDNTAVNQMLIANKMYINDGNKMCVNYGKRKKPFYAKPLFWAAAVGTVLLVRKILQSSENVSFFNDKVSGDVGLKDKGNPKIETVNIGIHQSQKSDELVDKSPDNKSQFIEEEIIPETFEEKSKDENKSTESNESVKSKNNTYRFIINGKTKKYHTSECAGVSRLTQDRREYMDIEAETENGAYEKMKSLGYVMCGACERSLEK